jgi:hypothetical protein
MIFIAFKKKYIYSIKKYRIEPFYSRRHQIKYHPMLSRERIVLYTKIVTRQLFRIFISVLSGEYMSDIDRSSMPLEIDMAKPYQKATIQRISYENNIDSIT